MMVGETDDGDLYFSGRCPGDRGKNGFAVLWGNQVCGKKRKSRWLVETLKHRYPCRQIKRAHSHGFPAHGTSGLDNRIGGDGGGIELRRRDAFLYKHVAAVDHQSGSIGIIGEASEQERFFGQTAQTVMASAAPLKFSHVVVAVHQSKSCRLDVDGSKKQAEEEESQEERVIFLCFFVHVVACVVDEFDFIGWIDP